MNIYIDLIAKRAITSPTDATPAVRPDFRAPTTYPINLYFLRQNTAGGYAYVRFPNSVIVAGIRSAAPVEVARFTLMFRGAETSEIDTRFSADQIRLLLEALPTIGAGNVSVAILDRSIVVEFVGDLGGVTLPTMSARIVSSTPPGAELQIEVVSAVSAAANNVQKLTLRRPSLAQASAWTEVTTGTTPGWTGTLNTTAVPVSAWENPVGDIAFEVTLTALTTRTATDGATVGDAIGRSGANGQVITSPGASGLAKVSDNGNDSFLVASDGNGVYGRKFVPNDIGREIVNSDGYVWQYTTIAEVLDDGVNNMARLSQRYRPEGVGLGDTITYSLTALPSDVYFSATANFTAADIGHVITGTNIVAGTRIITIINAQYVRLSQRPTAIGVSLPWTIAQEVSTVFTSATGVFQSSDVGAALRAPQVLDGDAKITKYISPTQVELDRRPDAAATGVQWTVIPVKPYPSAAVSRLITGSVGSQEVQKIALAQAASGGTLTVQDGYGGTMPVAVLTNPVGASDLQRALKQTYTNYGDLSVQEVIPGAEWDVVFGNTGQQRLLLVDETQATYEGALLNWIMVDGVSEQQAPGAPGTVGGPDGGPDDPTTEPRVTTRNNLKYIGADPQHLDAIYLTGQIQVSRITDGTNALMLRMSIMIMIDQYNPPVMNATMVRQGKTFYFIGDEHGAEKNGLLTVTYVMVTKPANRVEIHNQQRTVMFPLYQRRGNITLDVQLVSTSVSTSVRHEHVYYLEGSPPAVPNDSPIGVVIHYSTVGGVEFPPALWKQNGFDANVGTWGLQFVQGWSRRRWMGHIWDQNTLYDTDAQHR